MATARILSVPGLQERMAVVRRRTERLFSLIEPEAFWMRPIPLRHPICFYRGHLAAFNVNTLLKRGLNQPGLNPEFELLFERGIDPADAAAAESVSIQDWPEREKIEEYVRRVDAAVAERLDDLDSRLEDAVLARQAALVCLEHEMMHQETLLYIFHQLPAGAKRRPPEYASAVARPAAPTGSVRIPAGEATLGAEPGSLEFGWDNEFPGHRVFVSEFEIDRNDVTNGDFLEFVAAGGYENPDCWDAESWRWRAGGGIEHPLFWSRREGSWLWRGMFGEVPLPLSWPVYVSCAEARAFANWKGVRLPTEPEFHRAAYGTPEGFERSYPWGEAPPDDTRGNFDFHMWGPVPVGSFPAGESAFGAADLLGNGWEWTSTVFEGFPGFAPMVLYPNYSADFFDGKHFVLKGGSSATAAGLLRRSFRNWFQPHYPYPYATFRCVRPRA